MYKIVFRVEGGEDVTVFAVGGETVLELARSVNVPVDAPCSGNGTCGKCLVGLIEGKLETGAQSPCLKTEALSPCLTSPCLKWSLACRSVICGDAVLFVPDTALAYIGNITSEVFSPQPEDETSYGLAIDVGTTTVSVVLVSLKTGFILAKATTGNGQIRYGADVINRIIEQQKPGGIKRMQETIVRDTLLPLIDSLCKATGVERGKITRMVLAANTTMNHLLLGVDANSIRIEPYEPAFLEFGVYDPASIGINVSPDAKLILAPNIGSYVGGDITAGVLTAAAPSDRPMWDIPEMTLFIDLGTNGEIVFGNNEFMMACACSAGPAFEGGDISCGMRATNGAIDAFYIDKVTTEPVLTVIGGGKPSGLCGSGLIDVVAELFRNKIIDGKGKFSGLPGNRRIRCDEYETGCYILAFADESATGADITITETDIDNFIRAKGAVFSGIMSLLSPLGFTPADIDDVLIAGGIGSGINIKNAICIGLLPDLPEEKYNYIGNSSLNGAYAILTDPQGDETVKNIAGNMTYIDLSSLPEYMGEFIAACFLPHTDEKLFRSARIFK